MSNTPCAIKDCPALARFPSMWCAIHGAMNREQREQEERESLRRAYRWPVLKPVTDRIEYEDK